MLSPLDPGFIVLFCQREFFDVAKSKVVGFREMLMHSPFSKFQIKAVFSSEADIPFFDAVLTKSPKYGGKNFFESFDVS